MKRKSTQPIDIDSAGGSAEIGVKDEVVGVGGHTARQQQQNQIKPKARKKLSATNAEAFQDDGGLTTTEWSWGTQPRTPMLTIDSHFDYEIHREPRQLTPAEADEIDLKVQRRME